ncbi:Neurochondrin-domain-containing protein [Staphylotrichum tortipilum]|uniref:Neurochondrin-domain-containing protein n=1 Tax=Staphylotrichum tortipilum TaxID=2831512 RepID=A0AAN6RU71_9PEZI|nr:Neurochondrin-domain-containing protein [Staphylotrichum longicolle]
MSGPASSTAAEVDLLAETYAASTQKIQTLLRAKDDTSRFVGLALLKSVLDNTPDLQSDEGTIQSLWESIPPKFLDRLIKTGSRSGSKPTKKPSSAAASNDMLDLGVSVIHTFAALLPEDARQSSRLLGRIPHLVACLLYCSDDTARLALETLVSLVNHLEGARAFTEIQDLSPLTEIAPSQPLALDTLLHAWLTAATSSTDKSSLTSKIDSAVGSLVSSFKGTDAVTLLAFLASLLPRLDSEVLPPNPKWLPQLSKFIRDLVISRPTAAGRAAFTNLAAALLETYPLQAPQLLFTEQPTLSTPNASTPSSYLLINLLLVDLRATLPTLLARLNDPSYYPPTAHRLTSAFNVLSHFIGFLLRSADSADSPGPAISPDLLLKLRTSVSETISLTAEYLRDRWDASVAGALGLHPDARTAATTAASGASRLALAWDAKSGGGVAEDGLVLAAVRAMAIWVREDDNELLRKEVAGLADMLVELYRGSGREGGLDFRRPVLVALEGVVVEKKGRVAVLENGGWEVLVGDLLDVFEASSAGRVDGGDAARGVEIVRVLLPVVEEEHPGPREAWMDVVTRVAAWSVPVGKQPAVVEECQVAVLQLATALLEGTHPGMRKRFVHSISAVIRVAGQLRAEGDRLSEEALEDVLETLAGLR